MLGDLRTQLRKIGRLDVFQSVGDKALEYFAAVGDDDDSWHTLEQRARNLRQIGEVRSEQGNTAAALEAFRKSLRISEKMAARRPDSAEALIALANSRFYVGYTYWQRGDLNQASALFKLNIPIVDGISNRDRKNTKWLVERAYAHTNLGRVLELEGAYQDALRSYRVVMEVDRSLMALEPENSEWHMELGFAHNNLGKLLTALGHLDEAESHYRKDLEIKRQIYTSDPTHNVKRSYFAVSLYFLGQLLETRGSYAEAESHLSAALKHFEYLTDVAPERKGWKVRRAVIGRELGKVQELTGRISEGLGLLRSSVTMLRGVSRADPQNTAWRREFIRSKLTLSDFAMRQADPALAAKELSTVKQYINALIQQEPSALETRELSVYADLCLARLANPDTGNTHLNEALQTLDEYFSDSQDPRIIELRAAVLAGLNKRQAAERLRQHLKALHYKSWDLVTANETSVSRPGITGTQAVNTGSPR